MWLNLSSYNSEGKLPALFEVGQEEFYSEIFQSGGEKKIHLIQNNKNVSHKDVQHFQET